MPRQATHLDNQDRFRFVLYATPADRSCAELEAMVMPGAQVDVDLIASQDVRTAEWEPALQLFPVPEGGRVFGIASLYEVPQATFCSGPVPPRATKVEVLVHQLGTRPGPTMKTGRYSFTAIALDRGRVLVAGASSGDSTLELFEPTANQWRALDPLIIPHAHHAATALPDGRVLISGGYAPAGQPANQSVVMPRVELFDPVSGVSTMATSMEIPRANHSATLLAGGEVLVAGGSGGAFSLRSGGFVALGNTAPAEVYEVDAGTWTVVGSMNEARYGHTATLLADGTVLIVGGHGSGMMPLSSTGIFDPTTRTFSAGPSLQSARFRHVAVPLADGSVLIAGGGDDTNAERYVPAQRAFVPAGHLIVPELLPCAARLPSGRVAVVGGGQLVQVFDPERDSWSASSVLSIEREGCAAWPIADGGLMVAGGYDDREAFATSEVVMP